MSPEAEIRPVRPPSESRSAARTSSSEKLVVEKAQERDPSAQDALLSFALPRSRAERPSTSRRFTSLPSVAPTIRPLDATARTTSGSGLFQLDLGWSPASMPVPTAAIGGALVKISASGPIPTSRYWLHAPCCTSTSFSAIASGEPGRSRARSSPTRRFTSARIAAAASGVAARALLDHALQHRDREGHARGLDRLQVHGCEEPRLARVARSAGVFARMASSVPMLSPPASRSAAAGSGASQRSRMVGKAARDVDHALRPDRRDGRASQGRPPDAARESARRSVFRKSAQESFVKQWLVLPSELAAPASVTVPVDILVLQGVRQLFRARVERVAQAVAEKVERQHGHEDREVRATPPSRARW